jgi:TonB family protein
MERALAHAAGRAASEEKPDEERAGQKTGSPQGTAESSEAGDAYFTAVHDAILENYVVPSVISERERLYLSATVLAYIGGDGRILRHDLQKKSGNPFFDQALETAIRRARLPPPPPELARSLRDNGVVLNFKP